LFQVFRCFDDDVGDFAVEVIYIIVVELGGFHFIIDKAAECDPVGLGEFPCWPTE